MSVKQTTEFCIYFTALDGSRAKIVGDDAAISAIEDTFRKAGIHFNEQVEAWDEGFYRKEHLR